ncbi:hypothetical protein MAPG_04618 [Magnaporthiopsis poae ATCC 64411]|uniref:Fungal STAND N-terminal Goodbye domain-containing protein n=1 Tax=Magnaporthiopsis poae (strain ATCC 64411 / 73-15) TaxID=644358 RepID=A0A0C4DX80_MAGP6|nr:hypothetical protein MAPG_04618 [Magnaporthiopsis poae ATCC 64411]
MKQDLASVVRSPLLCNSAAEFIETRLEQALGVEVASAVGSQMTQYSPEADRFMLNEDIIAINCLYAESREKAEKLKARLADFSSRIHGLDARLNIDQKRPEEYNMNDVLNIVECIKKKHSEAENAESFLGAIRRLFRSAGRHSGALKTLMGFAPDDIYGSVITGGLTMILGAIERADRLRGDIYSAAAKIPLQMMEARELLRPYNTRMDGAAELHRRADLVFVAVFDVLFALVDEVTKNLGKRNLGLFRQGGDYGKVIDESLGTLESSVKNFRRQADLCLHQRVEQIAGTAESIKVTAESTKVTAESIKATTESTKVTVENIDRRCCETKDITLQNQTFLTGVMSNMEQLKVAVERDEGKQAARGQVIVTLLNNIYKLCKESPIVDNRSGAGGLDLEQYLRRQQDREGSSQSLARQNGETTGKWLANLANAHRDTGADEHKIMEQLHASDQMEKDKVYYLLMSDRLAQWIGARDSTALIVQSKTGDDMFNAVSFVSAFIHHSLCSADRSSCPVLGFFGGCRALEDTGGSTTRPEGMLAALFAQLLEQVKSRDDIDMSLVGDPPRRLPPKPEGAIKLLGHRLRRLIEALSADSTVFIVLDSVWRMSGHGGDKDEALRRVLDLVPWADEKGGGVVVKILATNFLGHAPYAKHQQDGRFTFLELPDTVESSGAVISQESLDLVTGFGGSGNGS